MSIAIYPFTSDFAAEIGDVDLPRPLAGADFEEIKAAFWKYAVLVFPGQDLTPEQHLAFSSRFGPVEKRAHARSEGDADPLRRHLRRHLQPDRGRQDLGRDEPPAHVQAGQQAVAHRQLVQDAAEPLLAALFADHRAHRRAHAVRGPARGLRCAARGDEEETARSRRRALDRALAPAQRLHGVQRGRDAAPAARAAGAGAHASPRAAASRCTSRPTPGASSACRTRKGARSSTA